MAKPLNIETLSASLRALGITPDMRLAVAVSGGIDSMTLAHLMWRCHPHDHLVFLTVDHRLRDSATREAEDVRREITAWGGHCRVLTWQDAAAGARLQERARRARYELLRSAAREDNCTVVVLGHHADDQAETFWMRLADGSGLSGLGGMQGLREHNDMLWARPLLAVTRDQISAYAQAQGVSFINDPSNENARFLRVRLRGFAEQLAAEGLDAARLTRTMAKLRAADDALATLTQEFLHTHVRQHEGGALYWPQAAFAALPAELGRRVLERALQTMTRRDYPPAYDATAELTARLTGGAATGVSLGGCLVKVSRGAIWVLREPASASVMSLTDAAVDALVWDGRFYLRGLAPLAGQGISLGALGEAGIEALARQNARLLWTEAFKTAPAAAKRGVAALWQGENLLAVPQFSWRADRFTLPLPDIRPVDIV